MAKTEQGEGHLSEPYLNPSSDRKVNRSQENSEAPGKSKTFGHGLNEGHRPVVRCWCNVKSGAALASTKRDLGCCFFGRVDRGSSIAFLFNVRQQCQRQAWAVRRKTEEQISRYGSGSHQMVTSTFKRIQTSIKCRTDKYGRRQVHIRDRTVRVLL